MTQQPTKDWLQWPAARVMLAAGILALLGSVAIDLADGNKWIDVTLRVIGGLLVFGAIGYGYLNSKPQ